MLSIDEEVMQNAIIFENIIIIKRKNKKCILRKKRNIE